MFTKIAAFVLAGSVATLAVVGVTDLVGVTNLIGHHNVRHRQKRVERRIERHIERQIGSEINREMLGTYVFDGDGEPFGFPWKAHVELELQPSGRFELRIKTDLDGELNEETSWGRYRLRHDRLVLYSGDDNRHEFRIDGDRLELEGHRGAKVALKIAGVDDAAFIRKPE